MTDDEWVEALSHMPPLSDEEWAAVHEGGRLLEPVEFD